MSTIVTRIQELAARIGVEFHAHKLLINNNANDLSALTTTTKTDLVSALNELKTLVDAAAAAAANAAVINDADTNTDETWSSQKISDEIAAAITDLIGGAPTALDTLKELADKLADEETALNAVLAALDKRVAVTAQTFTSGEQAIARANIGALSTVEIGNPDTDFVPGFESNL